MNAQTQITAEMPQPLSAPIDARYQDHAEEGYFEEEMTVYYDMTRAHRAPYQRGGDIFESCSILFVQMGGLQLSRDQYVAMVGKDQVHRMEEAYAEQAEAPA